MTTKSFDATRHASIATLGQRVLEGEILGREEGLWLFGLETRADIFDLLSWANRVREAFKGNRVHLCSIVNIKAGRCPEDCRFCAQSAFYQTGSPQYDLIDKAPILQAAAEARAHGVTGFGLVAAWRGLAEGPALDQICERFDALKAGAAVRADASLGIIKDQKIADRLRRAGVECYNHNLESSPRFYPRVCSTHTYAERVQTIAFLKRAGITICSGGIIGLGETREDRCDLALSLREIGASIVPINIYTPIAGTPLAGNAPLAPLEILKTIACFRLLLPRQEIMVAGGRTVNLRDLQSFIFAAGANALMIGNYLTTLNQPVEKDLQMIRDLGLEIGGPFA